MLIQFKYKIKLIDTKLLVYQFIVDRSSYIPIYKYSKSFRKNEKITFSSGAHRV